MKDEMDFELMIGRLPLDAGPAGYYPSLGIIVVDKWTLDMSESYMADILSHEYLHHLLTRFIGIDAGHNLDALRCSTVFGYKVALLSGEDDTLGNGVI